MNADDDLEPIDPLRLEGTEYDGFLAAAKKRELSNIIKSYVSTYDVFSEAIQNALDSIDRRHGQHGREGWPAYGGRMDIRIDLDRNELTVSDNGTGFDEREFVAFLAPNMSFNKGNEQGTRGNKGVGASYLAFGFDYFCVNTKSESFERCVEFSGGRSWVDHDEITDSPKMLAAAVPSGMELAERGASVRIRVGAPGTKPKTLGYFSANTPEQWSCLLRAKTPLGSMARDTDHVSCTIHVKKDGKTLSGKTHLGYPYPQEFIESILDLDDYLVWQKETIAGNGDPARVPARFERRTGIYKFYSEEELLDLGPNWTSGHETLLRLHSAHAYAAFMHSTDVWDLLNDRKMNLRKGLRTLRGGPLRQDSWSLPPGSPSIDRRGRTESHSWPTRPNVVKPS